MKKLFVYTVITMFIAGTSIALPLSQNSDKNYVMQQGEQKAEIKMDELPKGVQETLSSEKYRELSVSKLYKVSKADGTKYYSVKFVNASGESTTVKFDESGEVIKSNTK